MSLVNFVRLHPACKSLIPYFSEEFTDTQQTNSRVHFYSELLSFFFSLLNHNPSKRPRTVSDVLDMPFMHLFLRNGGY